MTEADADGGGDDQTVVYRLSPDCTIEDLNEGSYYHATVDAVVDYGMFVRLSSAVSGLVHESNYDASYAEGDDLVVELAAIRDDGDLSFVPGAIDDYETATLDHDYEIVDVAALDENVDEYVHLDAAVVQIKQTGGPTLFHVADGTGVAPCAAFERAGVRAYPEVVLGDLVHVVGSVDRSGHGLQIEVDGLEPLRGDRAAAVRSRLDATLSERARPRDVEPLVEWSALSDLRPDLERVAERLRRAVLEGRPVVLRHHADTDGMCAALPLERAVERFLERTHTSPEAPRHLVKRLPSRAPYYEMEDVTRDLSHALEDRDRHGQQLPVLVMIDNGSTAEDVPAYRYLDTYDVPVVAIDHHSPDPDEVAPYLDAHVNPYLHGEDYRVTAGMMSVEIARMIDPDLSATLRHVPAVAGLADRSAADAMDDYLALAADAGYDEAQLDAIGDALDYAAYWLRYDAGRGLTDDVLHLDGSDPVDEARREGLVDLLASRARRDIDRQLDDALSHVASERLSNGVRLHRIDVERHARRFTYPAPGTTTGAIHDHLAREAGEPTITIGVGPDFAVLRSDGVRLDIPEMVTELNAELEGAGVSGGGHLVVGSIRFVKGMREPVLDALIEKMATAEIDESLGVTATRAPFGRDG